MTILGDRVKDVEEQIAAMEPALRSAVASQGVHEFMLVHLLSHLGTFVDDRESFMAAVMQGVEMSMKVQADQVRGRYGEGADRSIKETLNYLERVKTMVMGTVEMPMPKQAN